MPVRGKQLPTRQDDDSEDEFGPRIVEPLEEQPTQGMSPKQVAAAARKLMDL